MILLHILGGLVGLTSGAVALSAPKGARLHRKSGMIFVYAMLVLSVSGAVMAALKPERISVMAGMLTFYLVITALLTVRHRPQGFDWMGAGAMVFALMIGLLSITFGIQGLSSSDNTNGITPIGFIFGAVALLAAFEDAHILLARSIPWVLRIMPLLCTPVLLVLLLMFYWLTRVLFMQWRPRI